MANKRPVASLNTREYDIIVQKIKEARTQRGLSQRKLAATLHQSTTYVLRIEQKERRVDLAEFIALARALDFNPVELLSQIMVEIDKGVVP